MRPASKVVPFTKIHTETQIQNKRNIPFMVGKGDSPKLNTARIVEAVVISLLSSIVVLMLMIPRMDEQNKFMREQITELKNEVQKIRDDFYIPTTSRE
jgi:hypothetical protein